jgi:hypothetical protein
LLFIYLGGECYKHCIFTLKMSTDKKIVNTSLQKYREKHQSTRQQQQQQQQSTTPQKTSIVEDEDDELLPEYMKLDINPSTRTELFAVWNAISAFIIAQRSREINLKHVDDVMLPKNMVPVAEEWNRQQQTNRQEQMNRQEQQEQMNRQEQQQQRQEQQQTTRQETQINE